MDTHDNLEDDVEEKDSLNLVSVNDFLDPIEAEDLVPIEEVQAAIEKVSYVRKHDTSDEPQPQPDKAEKPVREISRPKGRISLKPGRKPSGRNDLIGIQATTEVKERFKQVTKERGWALGQTLQFALEALERELEQGKPPEDN